MKKMAAGFLFLHLIFSCLFIVAISGGNDGGDGGGSSGGFGGNRSCNVTVENSPTLINSTVTSIKSIIDNSMKSTRVGNCTCILTTYIRDVTDINIDCTIEGGNSTTFLYDAAGFGRSNCTVSSNGGKCTIFGNGKCTSTSSNTRINVNCTLISSDDDNTPGTPGNNKNNQHKATTVAFPLFVTLFLAIALVI